MHYLEVEIQDKQADSFPLLITLIICNKPSEVTSSESAAVKCQASTKTVLHEEDVPGP